MTSRIPRFWLLRRSRTRDATSRPPGPEASEDTSSPIPTPEDTGRGTGGVSVEGIGNRVVGAGAHNNILGDVHGGFHQHIHPPQSASPATAVSREEMLTAWARQSRNRLIERWSAVGLDDETAANLADDSAVGAAPSGLPPLHDRGLVLLEGVFGSGKSVTAERLHQADLATAVRSTDAPLPVYLDARSIHGALSSAVLEASAPVGAPDELGVRLILDGLDEVSLTRAAALLTEARSLTADWPGSRVVATARPGLPGARDSERMAYPPMSEEEAASLAQSIGGKHVHNPVRSVAVHEALNLPLFVIIAVLSFRESRDVPSSSIDFLENLVERGLRRPGADISGVRAALAHLARLVIEADGPVPAGEVGTDAEVEALIASRLVVRRGRTLAFGLPILEQYFGGKGVLDNGLPEGVLDNAAILERWRYPLALALAAASWDRSVALLQPIVDRFPGIAAWLVHESIPADGQGSHGAVHPRCGDRIHRALAAWLPALAPATGLLRVGNAQYAPPLVLAVYVENGTVLTASRHTPTDDGRSGVLQLARPPENILTFHGSAGSFWHGYPAADYSAWPWRWGLDWITRDVAKLLKDKQLHQNLPGPAALERRWAQCRTIVQGTHLQERLSADEVISRLHQILSRDFSRHHFRAWAARREDLQGLLKTLEAGDGVAVDGYVHCPYPAPDLVSVPPTAHYGHYSNERLTAFIEHIHATAVDIYQSLCETWFPRLTSTLGLASILPVRITGHVARVTEGDFLDHEYCYDTCPLPVGERSTAAFTYCESGLPPEEWSVTLKRHAKIRQVIEDLHPDAVAWAHPRSGDAVFPSVTDTPATNLAYKWLWEDLRALRIVSGIGPR